MYFEIRAKKSGYVRHSRVRELRLRKNHLVFTKKKKKKNLTLLTMALLCLKILDASHNL